MLSCEDAFALGKAALAIDPAAFLAVGPIPTHGQDYTLPKGNPGGFKIFAEKAPNARGVRRVLEALSANSPHKGYVATFEQITGQIASGEVAGVLLTGGYPTNWVTPDLEKTLASCFVALIDILPSSLSDGADVLFPGATWAEKDGSFVSARNMAQGFSAAIPVRDGAFTEAAIAAAILDAAGQSGSPATLVPRPTAESIRESMTALPALADLVRSITIPAGTREVPADMQVVEL
jgi:NADH-quinone oxidoreductase subunit G